MTNARLLIAAIMLVIMFAAYLWIPRSEAQRPHGPTSSSSSSLAAGGPQAIPAADGGGQDRRDPAAASPPADGLPKIQFTVVNHTGYDSQEMQLSTGQTIANIQEAVIRRSGIASPIDIHHRLIDEADLTGLGPASPPPQPRQLVNEQAYQAAIAHHAVPLSAKLITREDAPDRGVLLSGIVPGSTAERNGVSAGDILVSLDGHAILDGTSYSDARGDRSRSQRLVCWSPERGSYSFDSGPGLIGFDYSSCALIGGDGVRDGEIDARWNAELLEAIECLNDHLPDVAETAMARAVAKGCHGRIIARLMALVAYHQGRHRAAMDAAIAALPRSAGQTFGGIPDILYAAALADNDLVRALFVERRMRSDIRLRTAGWSMGDIIAREIRRSGPLISAETRAEGLIRTDLVSSLVPVSEAARESIDSVRQLREITFDVPVDHYEDCTFAPAGVAFDLSCAIDLHPSAGAKPSFNQYVCLNFVKDEDSGPWISVEFDVHGTCTIWDYRTPEWTSFEFWRDPWALPVHAHLIICDGQFSLFIDGRRYYAGPSAYALTPSYVQFKMVGCHGSIREIHVARIDGVQAPPP